MTQESGGVPGKGESGRWRLATLVANSLWNPAKFVRAHDRKQRRYIPLDVLDDHVWEAVFCFPWTA